MTRDAGGASKAMDIRLAIVVGLLVGGGCDPESKSAGQASEGDSAGQSTASCEAEVSADDFDNACTQNTDCVNVFQGPSTDACRHCASASISSSEEEAYASELGPESCVEGECLADCGVIHGSVGACVENQCTTGAPFACGDALQCNGANELCVFYGSDIVDVPGEYGCAALPEACADSDDCNCLIDEFGPPNFSFCIEAGGCEHNGAGFEIVCPGG